MFRIEIPIAIINLPLLDECSPFNKNTKLPPNWVVISKNDAVIDLFRYYSIDSIPYTTLIDTHTLLPIQSTSRFIPPITEKVLNYFNSLINTNGDKQIQNDEDQQDKTAGKYIDDARNAFNNGQLVEAASHFSSALCCDDSLLDASYNLGVIAHTCGRPLLAVSHLQKVVLANPSDRTTHAVLGGVIGELEPAATIRAYQHIVKLQPK